MHTVEKVRVEDGLVAGWPPLVVKLSLWSAAGSLWLFLHIGQWIVMDQIKLIIWYSMLPPMQYFYIMSGPGTESIDDGNIYPDY